MDETTIRDHAQAHADAVVSGDMDALTEDFAEALRPQIRELARALPRPVTGAEVLSVDVGDPVSVALIRYAGESDGVTIRSEWQEEDGRPRIVKAEPRRLTRARQASPLHRSEASLTPTIPG